MISIWTTRNRREEERESVYSWNLNHSIGLQMHCIHCVNCLFSHLLRALFVIVFLLLSPFLLFFFVLFFFYCLLFHNSLCTFFSSGMSCYIRFFDSLAACVYIFSSVATCLQLKKKKVKTQQKLLLCCALSFQRFLIVSLSETCLFRKQNVEYRWMNVKTLKLLKYGHGSRCEWFCSWT